MIYNEARQRIGIDKERCVVVEDSMVGLRAAKAAVSENPQRWKVIRHEYVLGMLI